MIAEALLVNLEQSRAMTRLLGLHLLEHLRRGRVFLPQAIGEVTVDAPVFLFESDRQREDLPLAEVLEILRHRVPPSFNLTLESRLYCESSDETQNSSCRGSLPFYGYRNCRRGGNVPNFPKHALGPLRGPEQTRSTGCPSIATD